ncbi:AEC family transporter [Derxia gummosa]|uniref:AEC family transporter n=1 Tax=Derxia gummosa DSM 723 TaxID=1121388 RepID=A0A8B6X2H5_9BURK|nr:AEC family transporter [Derxia gummosa]
MQTALLLLPDFALIALGVLLARRGGFAPQFWVGVERLVYFILFPALLVHSIARTSFHAGTALGLVQCSLGITLAGALLGSLALAFKPDARRFASGLQCAFRFNSYVALALASRLGGEPGTATMAVIIGVAVPLANAMAVLALARHSGAGLWRELARNPLLVATLGGLAFNLAGGTLAEPVAALLSRLGQASIALGLIAVGAGLQLRQLGVSRWLVGWFTFVKLGLLPLVAFGLAQALALPPAEARVVLLFGCLPTASSAYVLAQRMGGDGPLVAGLISLSTLLSMLGIPLWLGLLG